MQMRGFDPRMRRIAAAFTLSVSALLLACDIILGLPPELYLYLPVVALATGGVLMLTPLWRASTSATIWVVGLGMCWYDVSRRGHAGPLFGTSLFMGVVMIILGFIVLGVMRRRTAGMP